MSASSLEAILPEANALAKLASLFSFRHDFLHQVGALMADRWPEATEVSFLDLFEAASHLWQELRSFQAKALEAGSREYAFNPWQLPEVEELRRLRAKVHEDLDALRAQPEENWLTREGLDELLALVPGRYLPSVGVCLFLQPGRFHRPALGAQPHF